MGTVPVVLRYNWRSTGSDSDESCVPCYQPQRVCWAADPDVLLVQPWFTQHNGDSDCCANTGSFRQATSRKGFLHHNAAGGRLPDSRRIGHVAGFVDNNFSPDCRILCNPEPGGLESVVE